MPPSICVLWETAPRHTLNETVVFPSIGAKLQETSELPQMRKNNEGMTASELTLAERASADCLVAFGFDSK